MTHWMHLGVAALVAVATLNVAAVDAADFPQRTALAQRSASVGLGRAQVTLLSRDAGPGAAAQVDALATRFGQSALAVTTRGSAEQLVKAGSIGLRGDGWLLQAYADGTRVRYRNYAALDAKASLARPVAQRLTPPALETLGRRFIAAHLADLLALDTTEALVPLFTEHEISGAVGVGPGAVAPEEQVTASTIVFGRTVDGVAVIGPGSKVAVLFANDGEPVGFDFDWPRYTPTARTQRVLALPEILERSHGLTSLDLQAPGVTVKRMECGYFDAGARRHDPAALIQAGCSLHYTQRTIVDTEAHRRDATSGHTLAAIVDVLPAGEVVERDHGWPQALRLTDGSEEPEDAAPPTERP
jgi:hypothetical protein